jgi:Flp pilus assembly protein TadG
MTALRRLTALFHRFRSEEKAVAAVEFALIMPFLLALYFGSMEAAALYTADKRVNSISSTIGDLVSQWDPNDGNLPVTTLSDYLSASTALMTPYTSTGLKIVVSLIEVKSDGTTNVLWSQANAAGTARVVGSAFSPLTSSTMMNQLAQGGCIIAAESSYSYMPVLGQVFTTALNLSHVNYFLPRYGAIYPINLSSTSLSASACTA